LVAQDEWYYQEGGKAVVNLMFADENELEKVATMVAAAEC
jgi:hypothetical protein